MVKILRIISHDNQDGSKVTYNLLSVRCFYKNMYIGIVIVFIGNNLYYKSFTWNRKIGTLLDVEKLN